MNSDLITVSVLEAALAGLLLLTVVKETFPRKHAADATVLRGEQSMNTLYIIYGIVTVVCSLAIEVAGAFEGNKSIMVLSNYVVLTYVFFFNSWFRNRVFFRIIVNRIKRD